MLFDFSNRRSVIAMSALALVVGMAGWWWLRPSGQGDFSAAPAAMAQTEETTGAPGTVIEMTLGQENAPVELIEYASYTCPHCARFHDGPYNQLKKEYIDTGVVRFVYREVYFDRYGLWASMVARCVPEKFFAVTSLIYDRQSRWTRAGSDAAVADQLRKIGYLAGIDQTRLEACLRDDGKRRALVEWYGSNTKEHDISSTPSFVIGNRTYRNMPYEELKERIEAARNS